MYKADLFEVFFSAYMMKDFLGKKLLSHKSSSIQIARKNSGQIEEG